MAPRCSPPSRRCRLGHPDVLLGCRLAAYATSRQQCSGSSVAQLYARGARSYGRSRARSAAPRAPPPACRRRQPAATAAARRCHGAARWASQRRVTALGILDHVAEHRWSAATPLPRAAFNHCRLHGPLAALRVAPITPQPRSDVQEAAAAACRQAGGRQGRAAQRQAAQRWQPGGQGGPAAGRG